jgi:hypothetical protein
MIQVMYLASWYRTGNTRKSQQSSSLTFAQNAHILGSANVPVLGSANAPVLGALRQPAQDGAHLLNGCGREPFEDLAKRGRGAATGAGDRGRTAGSSARDAGPRTQLQLFDIGELGATAGKVGGEALKGVQDGTIPGAPGTLRYSCKGTVF